MKTLIDTFFMRRGAYLGKVNKLSYKIIQHIYFQQDRAPLSYITQEKNSTIIKGHGIAFEILNTLSEKFGFTYDVFVPARRTLMNEKGGILHMLTQGVSLISWLSNTYCYLFKWSNCHSYSILYHPLFLLPSTHAQPI